MDKTLFCKNCQMYVSEILLQHEEKFLIKGDLSLTGYNPILKGWICPNCGERHYFKHVVGCVQELRTVVCEKSVV